MSSRVRASRLIQSIIVLAAIFTLTIHSSIAQTTETLTIAAPAMTPVAASSHNGSPEQVCGSVITTTPVTEFDGVLYNSAGSYIAPVQIPQGTTVTSLSLAVHDFTDPEDTHVYLVRKRAIGQTSFTANYVVMASVVSTGFANNVRVFKTVSILDPVIDNTRFGYFVELVNCDSTIQPVSVQIGYTTP